MENAKYILKFLQKQINPERKTQHTVSIHANNSNGIKILTLKVLTFLETGWGGG